MAFIPSVAPVLSRGQFLHSARAASPARQVRPARHRVARMQASSGEAPSGTTATEPAVPTDAPFNWLEQWYPCAWTDDLQPLKPFAFTIWERRYVLFQDTATGQYVVMDDVCPHRAAPLSEGRLYEREQDGKVETILECGYHGWRFNCSGRCVDIPVVQLEKKIPAAADVGSVYATSVQFDGLVFVYIGDRSNADESKIPKLEVFSSIPQEHLTMFRNAQRTVPTNFITTIENVADPIHAQFSHHGVQGNRNVVQRTGSLKLVEDFPGQGVFAAETRTSSDGPIRSFVRFTAPVTIHYSIGKRFFLLVWVVPVDHATCEVFVVNYAAYMPWKFRLVKRLTPRWMEHFVTNAVLDGDAVLLRRAEETLQISGRDGSVGAWKDVYTLASGSWDKLVIRLRRWLDEQADDLPYLTKLPVDAPLEKATTKFIIDRYEHHTKKCGACGPALKNLRKGFVVSLVMAGVGAAAALFSGLIYLALADSGQPFSAQPLAVAGGVGTLACVVLLLVARQLYHFIELLTYSDVAKERRLAP